MSINHNQNATKTDFLIGGKACRSMLFLDGDLLENKEEWPCTPDVLAFGDTYQGNPRQSTLPFLLTVSAQTDHDSFAERLTQCMDLMPDALILSDAQTPADCQRLDALLRVEEALRGKMDGKTKFLLAMGKKVAGFANLVAMAKSSRRLIAIGQDTQAVITAIGATSASAAESVLNTTRSHIQLAAASAHICAFEVLDQNADESRAQALIQQGFGALATRDPKRLASLTTAFSMI